MSGRNKFTKYQRLINVLVTLFGLLGKGFNKFCLRFCRNTNGNFGLLLRYVFIRNIAKIVGNNVSIHGGVYLFNIEKIELGNNISIHPMCYIEGAGGIKIGNDVSIAHASSLISTEHTWGDPSTPIKYNQQISSAIEIGDDVWIGCGVRILAGVTVSKRVIVAAGAVVNKPIPSHSLVGGVPAKFIKNLNE